MFLLEGFGLLLYLIMWVVVPLARTPEDRLRMSGQTVNPDSLNSQILQDQYTTPVHHDNSGCAKGCLILLCLPFLFVFGIALFAGIAGIGGGLFGGVMGIFGGILGAIASIPGAIMEIVFGHPGWFFGGNTIFWWGVALLLLGIGLIIFALVHHSRNNGKPMSTFARILLGLIIIVCLLVGASNIYIGRTLHNDYVTPSSFWKWNRNINYNVDIDEVEEAMDELEDQLDDMSEDLDDIAEELDSIGISMNDSGGNIIAGPIKMKINSNGASVKINKPLKVTGQVRKTVITN